MAAQWRCSLQHEKQILCIKSCILVSQSNRHTPSCSLFESHTGYDFQRYSYFFHSFIGNLKSRSRIVNQVRLSLTGLILYHRSFICMALPQKSNSSHRATRSAAERPDRTDKQPSLTQLLHVTSLFASVVGLLMRHNLHTTSPCFLITQPACVMLHILLRSLLISK